MTVNQRLNGGQWNLLGVYSFSALADVTVVQTAGITVADAVRFVPVLMESLEITGPMTVNEDSSTADYNATVHYSGGLSLAVQPQTWAVNMFQAAIDASGLLTAGTVNADTPVRISAQYSLNGATVSGMYDIVILNSGAPTVIVDNLDPGTSSAGTWSTSGSLGFYATNSVYSNTAGSTFTFPATLVPGTT
jgi:hypothetical protein